MSLFTTASKPLRAATMRAVQPLVSTQFTLHPLEMRAITINTWLVRQAQWRNSSSSSLDSCLTKYRRHLRVILPTMQPFTRSVWTTNISLLWQATRRSSSCSSPDKVLILQSFLRRVSTRQTLIPWQALWRSSSFWSFNNFLKERSWACFNLMALVPFLRRVKTTNMSSSQQAL